VNDATVRIDLDGTGSWRASGCYLGHEPAIAAPSLWDCHELCKQRVWDVEMAHDASSGAFTGAVRAHPAIDPADRRTPHRGIGPAAQDARDGPRLDADPE
jgi:hypothetical protein